MRYRKKPVVIEAVQWNGESLIQESGLPDWLTNSDNSKRRVSVNHREDGSYLAIQTLEGTMEASVGDYIIKGIKNEIYPCKPDIFEETYELVEDQEQALDDLAKISIENDMGY